MLDNRDYIVHHTNRCEYICPALAIFIFGFIMYLIIKHAPEFTTIHPSHITFTWTNSSVIIYAPEYNYEISFTDLKQLITNITRILNDK